MKFYILVAIAITTGCANAPLSAAPTADNPCGETYVVCLNMDGKPNGSCCGQNKTCGGGKYSVGCPAGECCFIGEPPDMLKLQVDGGIYGSDILSTPQFKLHGGGSR
jgi:hypothetical protein